MILRPQLTKLSKWILKYNTYFDRSFDFVEQSESTGIVHNGSMPVFPGDNFGAYFYLRVPSQITVSYENQIADNGLSPNMGANIVLVAYMPDGDFDKLAANLLTTIGRYEETNRITNILIHAEDVIAQELAKISPQNIEAALQKSQNAALVAINFYLQVPYVLPELNCITKPCRTC